MAFSATFVLCMRRNGYLWTSDVKLDTTVRFPDPDSLLECKTSAIWRRFPLIIAFYILNARFVWPTDLESKPHASTPTLIISTKFEVDMTIHCRVTAFLSADTSRDLVTLTFDLLIFSSCHTWRVTCPTLPPSLKTLQLFTIRYDTRCYFNVRSKADISPLNLPHGTDN